MPENNMGERIRICREQRGVSQAWLADALGMDRSTIFRYEKGMTGRIQLPIVEKIAELLGTSTAYLYYGADSADAVPRSEERGENTALQSGGSEYETVLHLDAFTVETLERYRQSRRFAVRVETDALQPRIRCGDLLYFTGCRTLEGSGVYLLLSKEGAFLSRVTAEGGAAALQPGPGDGQTLYTLEKFEKSLQVVGRAAMLASERP